MRKRGLFACIFLAIVLFSLFSSVLAQIDTSGLEESIENVKNTSEKIKGFTEKEERANFLTTKWKELFLENKYFKFVDSLLEKISFVFFIFLGMGYEFLPVFFIALFLWGFHFYLFLDFLSLAFPFNKSVSVIVCMGILIVLAQVKYIVWLSNLVLSMLASGWVVSLLVLLFFIVIFIILKGLKGDMEKSREEIEKMKEKANRESLDKMAKAMRGKEGFMEKYTK